MLAGMRKAAPALKPAAPALKPAAPAPGGGGNFGLRCGPLDVSAQVSCTEAHCTQNLHIFENTP